jgi:hypothetical protein
MEAMGFEWFAEHQVWVLLHVDVLNDVIDFSTWTNFGKLWEWAQGQEWWSWFVHEYIFDSMEGFQDLSLIHPDRFADALYQFLKERES